MTLEMFNSHAGLMATMLDNIYRIFPPLTNVLLYTTGGGLRISSLTLQMGKLVTGEGEV